MQWLLKMKNLLISFGSFTPIVVFIAVFCRLTQGCPLAVRIGLTILFVFVLCRYASTIFPFIFKSSFFQWLLYLFLRLENFRLENGWKAFIWGCLFFIIIPNGSLWLFIYFELDLSDYIYFLMSYYSMFFNFSNLIKYFLNPHIEDFQFLAKNQNLDKITWDDFTRSMSIVSRHHFKHPVPVISSIGSSRSKFPLIYITKRSMFRAALVDVAIFLTDKTVAIGTGCTIVGVLCTAGGVYQTNSAQKQAAKAQEEAAKAQVRVAEINANSQERVAQINADVEMAKLKSSALEGSSSWWWFKKEVSPKPEDTSLVALSKKVISTIVGEG